MADIFREVDEEIRKDQALAFWNRHKTLIIAAIVAIVVAVVGINAWRYYKQQQALAASDAYAAAIETLSDGRQDAALAALGDIVAEDRGGYGLLARLQRANLLLENGDKAGAIALWDEIADEAGAGDAFRAVATLLSVLHQLSDGDQAALRARLAPLTAGGQSFRATALELQAVLALRSGERSEAYDLYQQLADDLEAPPGLRARAAEMVAALKD